VAVTLACGHAAELKSCVHVVAEPVPQPCVLLSDKRHDADLIRGDLEARYIAVVIPARRSRKGQQINGGHI
jgi:hypothetical protein